MRATSMKCPSARPDWASANLNVIAKVLGASLGNKMPEALTYKTCY